MKVAVITPYFREPLEFLKACHESVWRQTHACTHFMVADGYPHPEVPGWPVQHLILAQAHDDVGNTPRAVGSLSAMNQGFEAIAYLDADNWYYANHIEAMVKLHEHTGAAVCTASRTIHRLDGSLLFVDRDDSDGRKHVDTNCFFITRPAFRLLSAWAMMPIELGPIADRVIWTLVHRYGLTHANNPEPTVAFRTQYENHYRQAGETPPAGAKSNEQSALKAIRWWSALAQEARDEWERRMGLRI